MSVNTLSVDAAVFSARSNEYVVQIRSRTIDQLLITEDDRVVAVMTAPAHTSDSFNLHEILRGTITAPRDFDPAAPVFDGTMTAEKDTPFA